MWTSPLSPSEAATLKVSASALRAHGNDLYWIEGRPELKGARVVVRWVLGHDPEIVSPPSLSLSSRVHEYGGGALCILEYDGPLMMGVRADDQAVVLCRPHHDSVEVLIEGHDEVAYGDLRPIEGTRFVLALREDRRSHRAERSVVCIDSQRGEMTSVIEGRDFFAHPLVNSAGSVLAWTAWDHPSMPWDASELWCASLELSSEGVVVGPHRHIAGERGRPASSPTFGDNDSILFVYEETGAGQVAQWNSESGIEVLTSSEGEFGSPLWELGETEIVGSRGQIYAIEHRGGEARLVEISGDRAEATSCPGTAVASTVNVGSSVAWMSPTPTTLMSVGRFLPEAPLSHVIVALGPDIGLEEDEISLPREVSGMSRHADEIFGLLYEPNNKAFIGPEAEAPPVIVFCHGGPTGQARAGFDPLVQSFTSRGFAVLAVNYSGSTGYGSSYRNRLNGAWGIRDVEDCVDLVKAVGEVGLVDPKRAGIRGSSAGGLTALLGLTTGAFMCGVSWYGVADLLTLAECTHDFESRYLDTLLGPLPESESLYRQRSPVTRASEMRGAVLILQGLDDPVVPPEQAYAMVEALQANDQEVELITFEGESHGFRRLETLVQALEAEISFFQRHLCQG